MRRLRALLLSAAVVAGAVAVPADAATAPLQRVTFVLRRTTNGPSSYTLEVGARNDTRGSFVGSVAARIERGKPVSATASWASSARRWDNKTLHAGSTSASICQISVCHDDEFEGDHGIGTYHVDDGGKDAPTHFFYAVTGKSVTVRFKAQGWKLVKTPLAFRYLDGGDTAAAHGHVGAFGAELYTDGSLPGGRYGSLAVGVPPCSLAASSIVARGAGMLTLEGGLTKESVVCPGLPKLVASYATKATTWRFSGTAVGENTGQDTRLFVIDLPARLP